jgi:competence protein ComEA
MTHPSRIVIAFLLLLASALAFANTPININTADEQTLVSALNGVGPAKARAIIAYRQEHGGFKSVDELANVKGIGEKTVDKNRQNITVEENKTK